MASRKFWSSRVLIGTAAAIVLVAITSVPGMVSAAPAKKYSLTVSPATATVGQPTTFTVTMTNVTPPGTNSNPSAFYVTVPFEISGPIDLPDTDAEALAGSSNANLSATVDIDPSNSSRILVRSLDAVNKSQFVKLTFTVTPASCTPLNYDWITGDPVTGSVKVTNGASLNGDTFSPREETVTTTVSCAPPALSVTKAADDESVVAGEAIGYTITVSNTGGGPATGVDLDDLLPTDAGLSWSIDAANSSSGFSITGGVLGFGPADLAAGASVHVHITSPTTSATVADSPVDNTASITATNVSPPAPASASISVFADGLSCENLSEEFDMDGGGTTTIGFADPADCTDVPFTFSYDRDANEFEIEKNELTVGLAVTVEWPAELAPTAAANLQVTPTEVTPPAPFHPVQWCEGDGTPENSTPPGVESWCILSQSASNFGPASGGGQLIQVTDELLLFGDANGRR